MKHHPYFAELLGGDSTRIAYGARTLNEGGFQSIPKLHFPGGALIGCSAGFVNVPKIKGTHNAMKSGMLAAEAAYDAVARTSEDADSSDVPPVDLSSYEAALKDSWVYSELREVRNLRPSFTTPLGVLGGIAYSGLDSLVLKGRVPWTFRNRTRATDAAHTRPAAQCERIQYPPFQPPLSTDLLTSVALTGTNHAEDQPVHLRVVGGKLREGVEGSGVGGETKEARREHVRRNVGEFGGLLGRACPAGVYEYVDVEAGEVNDEGAEGKRLVINSQVSDGSL